MTAWKHGDALLLPVCRFHTVNSLPTCSANCIHAKHNIIVKCPEGIVMLISWTLSRAAETSEWSTAMCLINVRSLAAASMLVLRFWCRQIRASVPGRRSAHNSRHRLNQMKKLWREHWTATTTNTGRSDITCDQPWHALLVLS